MSTLSKRNTKGHRINDEDEYEYVQPIDTADQEKIVTEFEEEDAMFSAIAIKTLIGLNICLGVLKLYYFFTAYPFTAEPNCASHPHFWNGSVWDRARWMPCFIEAVSSAGFFGCAYLLYKEFYFEVVKYCVLPGVMVMGILRTLSKFFGSSTTFYVSMATNIWLTGLNAFVSILVYYALGVMLESKDKVSGLRKKMYTYKSV